MSESEDDDGDWYGEAMLVREGALQAKFGPTLPSDMVIAPEDVAWDMRIPGFAFLRYAPNQDRPYWLWLTHGLSQPFMDGGLPQDRSSRTGFGVEFAIATPQDEPWAARMLETVSAYLFGGSRPVFPTDRLPSSDLMFEAPGGSLLVMEKPGYDTIVETRRYTFQILHLVGTTATEIARAKRYSGRAGSQILECALHRYGIGCVTDRNRASIAKLPDFETVWHECGGNSSNEREPPSPKKRFWQR